MTGFLIASIAAAVGFFVHAFLGSRLVVAPLLASTDLTRPSRWLMFLCWHAVTVLLAALALGFAAAWRGWGMTPLGLGASLTVLAAVLAGLTLYVGLRGRLRPWRLPPFLLFTLMAAGGLWVLLSAGAL